MSHAAAATPQADPNFFLPTTIIIAGLFGFLSGWSAHPTPPVGTLVSPALPPAKCPTYHTCLTTGVVPTVIRADASTIFSVTATAEPRWSWGYSLHECWDRDCVIGYSPGGMVDDFARAAHFVNSRFDALVVIDGPCIRACTGFAAVAREHVCLTPESRFGYHTTPGNTIPDVESEQIIKWVNAHGGFPTYDSGDLLWMKYEEARAYWRTCTRAEMQKVRLLPEWNYPWREIAQPEQALMVRKFDLDMAIDTRVPLGLALMRHGLWQTAGQN